VFRVPQGLWTILALAAAGCPSSSADDCPPGTTLVESLCVPARHNDPLCDSDRDDYLSFACGGDDCDDDDAAIHPRATERCNDRDDDCDGLTDEALDTDWFADADGDGFGAGPAVRACAPPAGYVATALDCDDADPDVHPGVAETCDGRDQDCDGFTDEGVRERFYHDGDGDGFGDPAEFVDACTAPAEHTPIAFDCDDADLDAWPGQTRFFDHAAAGGGFDYDCDGSETPRVAAGSAACDDCTAGEAAWAGGAPACGVAGILVSCGWSTATGCSELARDDAAIQECR
jgi:hypothetical protein